MEIKKRIREDSPDRFIVGDSFYYYGDLWYIYHESDQIQFCAKVSKFFLLRWGQILLIHILSIINVI